MTGQIVTIDGIRYRREDAELRGLIEAPKSEDLVAEQVATRTAELEAEFDKRVQEAADKLVAERDSEAKAKAEAQAAAEKSEAEKAKPEAKAKTPANKAAAPKNK